MAGRRRPAAGTGGEVPSSRTVTDGDTSASPLCGGPYRLDEQRRAGVLEDEADGAAAQRAVDVLVEVERRHHDDPQRVGDVGPGQRPGHLDAVDAGHPDVDQAHVRPQPAGQLDGLDAVDGFADHGDVGLVLQDEAQAAADHGLVVGDQHADGHGRPTGTGSVADTVQPPPGRGPASTVPPRLVTRSRMPISPKPPRDG